MRRLVMVSLMMAGLTLVPSIGLAGGDAWEFGQDSYEPGEDATGILLVDPHAAAVAGVPADELDLVDVFGVYLVPVVGDSGPWLGELPPAAVHVGTAEIVMGDWTAPDGETYRAAYQVHVAFVVPNVPLDDYWVWVCNEDCEQNLVGTITCCRFTIGPKDSVPVEDEHGSAATGSAEALDDHLRQTDDSTEAEAGSGPALEPARISADEPGIVETAGLPVESLVEPNEPGRKWLWRVGAGAVVVLGLGLLTARWLQSMRREPT